MLVLVAVRIGYDESFKRICGALREVLESKITSSLSVELSDERFVIRVQETRTRHARVSQTSACSECAAGSLSPNTFKGPEFAFKVSVLKTVPLVWLRMHGTKGVF